MKFLSKFNLLRFFALYLDGCVQISPCSDLLLKKLHFFECMDVLKLRYHFKWQYYEHSQKDLYIERFMSSYMNQTGGVDGLVDKIYAEQILSYQDVLMIARTREVYVQSTQDALTKNGVFEDYIYMYMNKKETLGSFLQSYVKDYPIDLLIDEDDCEQFRFDKQKKVFVAFITKKVEDYGRQFKIDLTELELFIKENYGHYDSYSAVNFLVYLYFNEFLDIVDHLFKPVYKQNFETQIHEIVDYRVQLSVRLSSRWFHEMDLTSSVSSFVSRQDFLMIKYEGVSYKLTEKQAKFISFLYDSHKKTGFDAVLIQDVKKFLSIYCDSVRTVRDLFRISGSRTHPLYKRLVLFDERNNYFLNKSFLNHVYFLPTTETKK